MYSRRIVCQNDPVSISSRANFVLALALIAIAGCGDSSGAIQENTTTAPETTLATTTTTTTLPVRYHEPTTEAQWVDCPVEGLDDSVRGRRLRVPGYPNRPTVLQVSENKAGPLVVLFHGMNGCIEKLQSQTDIEEIGTAYGVNLLWLSGEPLPTRSWNTNGTCCEPASTRGVDDFAYIQAALDKVKSLGLTPSKYLSVGKSNGAGMAVSVGCHFPEIFSVVVSVAGWAPTSCVRANLSLVAMGGSADERLGSARAATIANLWRSNVVNCPTDPNVTQVELAKVTTWRCDNNTFVRLAQLDGIAHVWPTFWFYSAEDEILGLARGTLIP